MAELLVITIIYNGSPYSCLFYILGSGALSGKRLLVRIFENDKIVAYIMAG